MDDDDIEDMIRDLIESRTAWTNAKREAALTPLRKVSISHQAAVQIIAKDAAARRSAGIKPLRPWMRRTPGKPPPMSGGAE